MVGLSSLTTASGHLYCKAQALLRVGGSALATAGSAALQGPSMLLNKLHSRNSGAHLVLLLLGFLLLRSHLAKEVQVLIIIVAVRASYIAETILDFLKRPRCITVLNTRHPAAEDTLP